MNRRRSLPAFSGDKDQALATALAHLVPAGLTQRGTGSGHVPDGTVAADVHVTAVRRLAGQPAVYDDWPAGTNADVVAAYARRGIERVYLRTRRGR